MAQILSGKEVSAEIQAELKEQVAQMRVKPKLTVVQVGDREDSNVYIRMKRRFAEEIGATSELLKLSNQTTEDEVSPLSRVFVPLMPKRRRREQLIREIKRLNEDPGVHGIIVQLPLQSDKPISQDRITNLVSPDKDVDGYVT